MVYYKIIIPLKPSLPLQCTLASLVDRDGSGSTSKSVSPGKQEWTKGQDPREDLNSLLKFDCYQDSWLCTHRRLMYTSLTASRESVIVKGNCLIASTTMIILELQFACKCKSY